MTGLMGRIGRKARNVATRSLGRGFADWRMPRRWAGDLLLTFDDGPDPEVTPQVLDLLDRHDARAIFFVKGYLAERHPDLVHEVVRRGHVVANHTFTHLDDVRDGAYDLGRVVDDIRRCDAAVRAATGKGTAHFRPPRGELNASTWKAARNTAHRLMLWSIEGGEWGKFQDWSADAIEARLIRKVRRRDMVLLHDDNEKVPQVLAGLLATATERGWDLVSAVGQAGADVDA